MTKSFLRFLLVGAFNTVFGYALIFGFMYGAHLSPELSNVLGYCIALIVSFLLNKYYTFARKSVAPANAKGELLRFLLVFLFAYTANYLALLVLMHGLNLHPALSQVLAGVAYVLVSYFLNSRFVFRRT